MARNAKIAATGVVSGLGIGAANGARQLLAGTFQPASTLALTGFSDPVTVPYHGVTGGPDDPEDRLKWLLDQALEELLDQVCLGVEERSEIPLFIGSSCYGIGIGESLYRQRIAAHSGEAMPMPLDGFSQISRHLQTGYGLTGPDFSLNTACTSTANAMLSALTAIRSGQVERTLIVGLEARNDTTLSGFLGMQLMAEEAMRPFDLRRNGLILGEGCGVLLLEADEGSSSGCYLAGGASNCDSYSISASNPDGSTVMAVMEAALNHAGISRESVRAIKAHGTATPLNDDSETGGMRRLFSRVPDFLSLKSAFGHTLGSCGVMETALFDACLRLGRLPASAGFAELDPALGISPLTSAREAESGHYLLNFFGFGGNNSSLVLDFRGAS